MEKKEALRIFEKTGALQNGHFQLSSGLHSPNYFQCALMLQYPEYVEHFCYPIVEFFREEAEDIDLILAPAMGGILVAYEVARQMGTRAIFAERVEGKMRLRRGFFIEPHENVLVVEDVITTGGSVQEIVDLAENAGAFVVGVGCIVNRSGGKSKLDIPICSVFESKVVTYKAENCPLCRQKIPLTKPGSRYL